METSAAGVEKGGNWISIARLGDWEGEAGSESRSILLQLGDLLMR